MNDFLRDNARLFVMTASMAVIVAVVGVTLLPPSYDVSFSVSVARERQGEVAEYAYDGFYAIRAAESVTDMVRQWLNTPEVVSAVVDESLPHYTITGLRGLEQFFFVRKRGAQYLEVRTTLAQASEAVPMMGSVEQVLGERLAQLRLNDAQGRFSLSLSDPVVVDGRPPLIPSALLAAFLAVGAVGLWKLVNPEPFI